MSVLIKNMEMPNSCSQCGFCLDGLRNDHDEICTGCMVMPDGSPWGCGYLEIDGIDHTKQRMFFCPLVALPGKHGRLIDADAFAKVIESIIAQKGYDDFDLTKFTTVGEVLRAVIAELKGTVIYGYKNTPTIIEAEGEG